MGRIDDIQTALKTFEKNRKKLEINFHDHFKASWIIESNEPAGLNRNAI